MQEDRDLVLLSVFTFVTILLWVFFELVKTSKTTTIPTNIQQIITPLSPKLDTDILTVLGNRKTY